MTFIYSPPPVVVDASVAIELLDGDQRWDAVFSRWAAFCWLLRMAART